MKRVKPIAKVNLIRISDAYILFKRTITVAKNAATGAQSNFTNKKIIFKNCVPFTDCMSEGKNTEVDNGKNIDVVKSVYNVIEFRYNYSKTSRSLWLYCRDEPTIDNNGDIIGFSFLFFFFFYWGFISRPFTNHRTAGEGGGHFFNSSLPIPPALQTLRN